METSTQDKKERARFLILRTQDKGKSFQVVIRVIFWYEPGEEVWCGRAIEAQNLFTCTEDEAKIEWMMADAAMTMIEFVLQRGGDLRKLLREPRPNDLEHWIALRKKEGVPLKLERCSLMFVDLYPDKAKTPSKTYISWLSHPQSYAQF